MTDPRIPEDIGTKPPQDPAAAAREALAQWLRETLYSHGPYGDDSQFAGFALVYADDFSREDHAAGRDTVIMQTRDGRYWHATITVTVTEQSVRTPYVDIQDGDE